MIVRDREKARVRIDLKDDEDFLIQDPSLVSDLHVEIRDGNQIVEVFYNILQGEMR
jgi:hypothetical protein